MSDSIDNKILISLKKRGKGTVFSTEEYAHYGDPDTVQKALSRMAKKGVLLHVCHGIYCYPKVETKLGLGILYPTFEDIAQTIAKRDKVRIFPASALAQNILGLSTQVPMNVVYLTDGSNRKVIIKDGRGILFRHAAPKKLAFTDKLAMLISTALREMGEKNVTNEHKHQLKKVLERHPEPFTTHDMKLMPLWIRNLITELYEQLSTTH